MLNPEKECEESIEKDNDQECSEMTSQNSKNLGIKNILQRYRSNSQILKFSNWFANATLSYDEELSNEVRFLGNCSDLWGLLAFQIKAIGPTMASNDLDINLVKKQIEFGQIYLLYKTQSKIKKLNRRLQIQSLYLDKIKRLRQQIQRDRLPVLYGSEGLKIRKISKIGKSGSQNEQQLSLWMLSESFQQQTTKKTTQNLKTLLKTLLSILPQPKKNQLPQKPSLQISLICLTLLQILHKTSWAGLCLSDFVISHFMSKYLLERNGVMFIGKYLHDASEGVLGGEVGKFYQVGVWE